MKQFLILLLLSAPALAIDTTIEGGRMELVNKGNTVLFTDGVKLVRGIDQLKAARMETNQNRDRVFVKGNVRLLRTVSSTETWTGNGDKGFYDTQTGAGYLEGEKDKKARVVHTEILSSTSTRIVTLYADRIDFEREKKRSTAKGRVQGDTVDPATQEKYEFWADQADFDGAANTIVLSGETQPLVVQTVKDGSRRVWGDKIVYNTETKNMLSEGNARAVFVDVNGVQENK